MAVTLDEHAAAVAALLSPVLSALADPAHAETVPLAPAGPARGRVLAADIASPIPVPPFTNSQMDGYAVRSADLAAATEARPVRLPIGRVRAAGDAAGVHEPGTATPVMTGAAIPEGADAVVQIEAVDPPRFLGIGGAQGDPSDGVAFSAPATPGAFVREVGSDVTAGQSLLAAGTRLGPAQLAALAAVGLTSAPVRPRPKVLLVSTGHELRAPGEPLDSGQIHDANTASLAASLIDVGAEVTCAAAPDDASALLAVVAAHPEADLLVTTGGVSAGAFEVVRDALEPRGVSFGHVAMQPGGPQGAGLLRREGLPDLPVIAFPGNPVSALLSFEMFLRPLLRRAAGLRERREVSWLPLAHAIESPQGKHQIRRGMLRDDGSVAVGAPGSHLLHDYARATVLVHVPTGIAALPAGAEVEVWRIDE
ncbi:molybdopterin molybdenumtransferase MoeA [Microbacterium sp. MYb72]|uniref:molybdopterin molybdotransferase MoeA n=1 Tax=Microbacterium sp. MYb72 TaxID=1848693 RepID=UPI000CFCB88B|nr:gephyrin-like molybdotransferase Glp [Microbacterium sp. MYb72]PRB07436.1 molybdopterin molybdenumtransferase MoeA [Microbacterium sp. MYb72]